MNARTVRAPVNGSAVVAHGHNYPEVIGDPSVAETRFDLRRLFHAIDAERSARDLTWAALAREVGVATTTIRRFAIADDAEADGVLALVRWLNAAPEDYVEGGSVKGERLASPVEGYVRVDMDLVAEANGDRRGANGRTRTTIQRLVQVAQKVGQPVASLTRLSEV